MEIDFETGAGQEMIDYIVAQSNLRNGKGNFLLEYDGNQFRCKVTTDGNRNPSWVEVCWKSAGTKRGAEQNAGGYSPKAADGPRRNPQR